MVKGVDSTLPLATVSLENKTVLTDQNGEFYFSVSPGKYDLIISHAGYKKIFQQLEIQAGNAQVLEFTLIPADQLEQVVVLGSRSPIPQSNLNTTVPVDVFSSDLLKQTGHPSLTQMLNYLAPSLNASRELLNEPVTLRGLNPDQTLILVNGFRYHSMAFIFPGPVRGILGRGSVSNDLNSIPFSAIDKIEIMRDGASAQYGSDAIAGVINIHLNKSTGRTSIQLHCGQYYEGDGENITLGINRGIAINKKGFVNLSADLRFRNHTYRGGEFAGTVYKNISPTASYADSLRIRAEDDSIIRARNFDRKKVSHAGNTKLKGMGFLMNGGYQINNNTELFWTAAMHERKNTFIGPYTFPKTAALINHDLFPNGFKALCGQNSGDISGIAGAKGETNSKWHWEFGSAYGKNNCDYYTDNTNNASQYFTLGKNAPSSFYTGAMIYQQLTNDINFVKARSIKTGNIKLSNIGFGAEWRMENYQIKAGEEPSWQNYDSIGRKLGGAQNSLIFQPPDEINETRNVLGVYVDLETQLKDNFLFDVAGRYEYYSDFGGNLAAKIAMRYKLSGQFAIRVSVGNGFRAPSLQQRFFSSTVTGPPMNITPTLYRAGYFHNDSEIAVAFGIPPLDAEKSVNLSGGFTATVLKCINLTVDAYWIQIKNRIVLSGRYDRNINREVDYLLNLHNLKVDRVQFFANAINTKSRGIDVVLNSNWKIKKATLLVMFAANFNRTHLFGEIKTAENLTPDSLNTNSLFNRSEKTRMEKGQPRDKIILSLNYKTGRFGFLLGNTHFGKTELVSITHPNDTTRDESFSSKILTDISINYTPKKWLTITVGANNVFDVYPDRLQDYRNTENGIFIYSQDASPFGLNGGYYFVNMSFSF